MISFIIPTLNEEKVIENTLLNISSCKCEKEIIVSDDRSSDRTVEIAKKYTDKVIIREESEPRNIGAKRNAGAKISSGEYLVFIDADIMLSHPEDFFDQALQYFKNDKDLVGLSVSIRVMPDAETSADKIVHTVRDWSYLVMNNYVGFSAASSEFQMVRKDAFIKTGGFDATLIAGEDNEFFHRLGKLGNTFIDLDLKVYNTGRRPHAIGWPKLLYQWSINSLFVIFLRRSASKEWTEIR